MPLKFIAVYLHSVFSALSKVNGIFVRPLKLHPTFTSSLGDFIPNSSVDE